MLYYQEITLIEQEEIAIYFIWSKLYTQLHLALVEVKKQDDKANIGISFPEYLFNEEDNIRFLGTKLRLFANSKEELQNLNIKHWLERLTDYVHISSIREVPEEKITNYALFTRKQIKTNAERLARRRAKKSDIDFGEAINRYKNIITKSDLPFIRFKSLTNKQPFSLFIEKTNTDKKVVGAFNSYGLSLTATVPEF